MAEQTSLTFIVEHPTGSTERLSVDSDNVAIGSGAHCEIRLTGEDVPSEQLRVQVQATGVFAEAQCMEPPALLHGVPFAQGRLLPGTQLTIGRYRVSVEHTAAAGVPIIARASKQQTSPLVLAMAAVGFPLGFYLLFTMEQQQTELGAPPEAPPLWGDMQRPECIHDDPTVAEAQAASYLAKASIKRERSPFAPEDGVEAVSLYIKAAGCYSKAGNITQTKAAEAEAEDVRQSVSRQFHVHQVRLERALATKEYESATTEARMLQTFLARAGGDYYSWLSDLQRSIKARFSGRE